MPPSPRLADNSGNETDARHSSRFLHFEKARSTRRSSRAKNTIEQTYCATRTGYFCGGFCIIRRGAGRALLRRGCHHADRDLARGRAGQEAVWNCGDNAKGRPIYLTWSTRKLRAARSISSTSVQNRSPAPFRRETRSRQCCPRATRAMREGIVQRSRSPNPQRSQTTRPRSRAQMNPRGAEHP